jgi:hypothetical protein
MLKLKELLAAVGIVAAVLFLTAAVGPGGDTGTPGTPGTVINTVAESGLLSVDTSKTNGIAATPAHVASALSAGESSTVLKYTSGLADNATNKAIIATTASTWTDPSARLLTLQNNSTSVFHVNPQGATYVGKGAVGFWGDGIEPSFVGIRDAALEAPDNYLIVGATDSGIANTYTWLKWYGYGGSGDPNQDFILQSRSGSTWTKWNVVSTLSSLGMEFTHAGGSFTDTSPFYIYPESLNYKFGSSKSTTNHLVTVSNAGTNKFTVAFSGATTIAQAAAEPTAPAAGYFTLFGIDNGSGKMILKVRFPTGASQTIATEP